MKNQQTKQKTLPDHSTWAQAVQQGASTLQQASATALLDSRLLLCHVLGVDKLALLTQGDTPLKPEQFQAFQVLLVRRQTGEPVAYLLGQQAFYGLVFKVSSAVLVPRPETEQIVEILCSLYGENASFTFADIGTGSGALAVTLAGQFPRSSGYAVDISQPALAVAQQNARQHQVAERLQIVHTNWLTGLPQGLDVVVSNPPYLERAHLSGMSATVAAHEPQLALDGGADGLAAYRAIIPQAAHKLKSGGILLLEIGWNQWDAVEGLCRHSGFEQVTLHRDLAGHPRVVHAQKQK